MGERSARPRVILASSLVLAFVGLAFACGEDAALPTEATPDGASPEASTEGGATADGSSAPPGDIAEFCDGTLALHAPKFEACCDPAPAPKQYQFDDTLLKSLPLACTQGLGKSVQTGRAALEPAAAATCRANVSAAVQ